QTLVELDPVGTTDELPEDIGGRRTTLGVVGDIVTLELHDADLASRLRAVFARWKRPEDQLVLAGIDPAAKTFPRLWKAIHPALDAVVKQLERGPSSPAREVDTNSDSKYPVDGGSSDGTAAN
ncbi:MAG: hypothetical protein ACRDRT_07240, partial [Pseudonocardiaceae bacterium]